MTSLEKWHLPENRYFGPDPAQRQVAMELYQFVANLPLIRPHGHVDPRLLADGEGLAGFAR